MNRSYGFLKMDKLFLALMDTFEDSLKMFGKLVILKARFSECLIHACRNQA